MKDKLKNTLEHEVELLGRSISVLALAGLLVVGGASAALLSSFGTVSGEADVTSQAISMADDDNEVSFSFDGNEKVPPFTDSQEVTLQNNNEEVPVSFHWEAEKEQTEGGDLGDAEYIDTGVYEIKSFDLYNSTYGKEVDSSDDLDSSDQSEYDVNVKPSVDTVTFEVELPESIDSNSDTYTNVELTDEEGNKYHIGYDTEIYYKEPSDGSKETNVEDFDPYVDHDLTDDSFSLTVDRSEAQSFAVDLESSDDAGYLITEEALKDDIDNGAVGDDQGGIYYGDADDAHQQLDYTNLVSEEVREYTKEVDFQDGEAKDVSVEVDPSVDTVTYDVELPYELNENDDHIVDLEIANEGETAFHVKYRPTKDFSEGSEDYGVKVYDGDGYTMKTVEEVDAVESVSVSSNEDEDGETLTVVVENPKGDQQFGLRGDYNQGDDSGHTSNGDFLIPEGFSYNDVDTFSEPVNPSVVTLSGDEERNYNVVTNFDVTTKPGDYEVTVEAQP